MKKKVILMSTLLTLSVGSIASAFSDVTPGKWYHGEIMQLKSRGIVNGYEDGSFKPYNNVSNSEALAMILRSVDIEAEVVANSTHWSDGIVSAGVKAGVINQSNFQRNNDATRVEVAEMIVKALGLDSSSGSQGAFADSSSEYANILYSEGILRGEVVEGKRYFRPNRPISRAELGALVVRVISLSNANEESEYTSARYFEFDSSKGEITGYSDNGPRNVVIPLEINGVAVNSIGDEAFKDQNSESTSYRKLNSVVIPDSVTQIGAWAFAFNNLKAIDLPNSITHIGEWAFASNHINSVSIPNSVNNISPEAFFDNMLTSVKVPEHTKIAECSFGFDVKVIRVNLNGETLYTNTNYFEFDKNLGKITGYSDDGPKDVIIPKQIDGVNVKTIGEAAFLKSDLTSVQIPDTVTSIEDGAFARNSLRSILIPNSVNHVGEWAFVGNELISIVIPSSITSISEGAFAENKLMSISIPDSVTYIGAGAFQLNKLIWLEIPSSVTFIDGAAFAGNDLSSVQVPNHTYINSLYYNVFDFNVEIIRY